MLKTKTQENKLQVNNLYQYECKIFQQNTNKQLNRHIKRSINYSQAYFIPLNATMVQHIEEIYLSILKAIYKNS
jgi:hypothetical protein